MLKTSGTDQVITALDLGHLGTEAYAERLKRLFAEVNALANQLRRENDAGDAVLAGGRAILRILCAAEGPLTVPEMGRVRSTSRQNIQVLVNRLSADGCVDLIANPAHKRSPLVRINERGQEVLRVVEEEQTKSLERLLAYIPEAEVTSVTESLQHIREALVRIETPGMNTNKKAENATSARKPTSGETGKEPRVVPRDRTRPLDLAVKTPAAPVQSSPSKQAIEEDFPVSLL